MFLYCSSAIAFWKTFQSRWANKTKQSLILSNSINIYGVFNNIEHRYSLNYTLLIAKFSIYCSCLDDVKLSFDSFVTLLRKKLNIYKQIAIGNETFTTFQNTLKYPITQITFWLSSIRQLDCKKIFVIQFSPNRTTL